MLALPFLPPHFFNKNVYHFTWTGWLVGIRDSYLWNDDNTKSFPRWFDRSYPWKNIERSSRSIARLLYRERGSLWFATVNESISFGGGGCGVPLIESNFFFWYIFFSFTWLYIYIFTLYFRGLLQKNSSLRLGFRDINEVQYFVLCVCVFFFFVNVFIIWYRHKCLFYLLYFVFQ